MSIVEKPMPAEGADFVAPSPKDAHDALRDMSVAQPQSAESDLAPVISIETGQKIDATRSGESTRLQINAADVGVAERAYDRLDKVYAQAVKAKETALSRGHELTTENQAYLDEQISTAQANRTRAFEKIQKAGELSDRYDENLRLS
jgi:hypothetical protein